MTLLSSLLRELHQHANKQIGAHSQKFFKTGAGEYGEGDIFIGVRVPTLRKMAKKYRALSPDELQELLTSKVHEQRLLALIIMVEQYKRGTREERTFLFQLYINHTDFINNWDLVDTSVHHIVGHYLVKNEKTLLKQWAVSKSVWERRMAIMATFHFIRKGSFDQTILISEMLLNDEHDLIHKAVGWMLREVGNRDLACEESFLKKYYKKMPRTMLRYAIEKFEPRKRKQYLNGEV